MKNTNQKGSSMVDTFFKPEDCIPNEIKIRLSKDDVYTVAYSSHYVSRPAKSKAQNILWVKPEDTLLTLFNNASYYFQSQKKWKSVDYLSALCSLFPYFAKPISSMAKFAKDNCYFLGRDKKADLIKELGLRSVKRIMKVPALHGDVYFVLQSTNQLDYEGNTILMKDKRVVFIDYDRIIGKAELLHQFCDFLDEKVSKVKEEPMDDFYLAIHVIKEMICKGLISGVKTMNHQNYSVLKSSVDALKAKRSKDYLDLNNWTDLIKSEAFAYKLFMKFILSDFHYAVRKGTSQTEYRGLAGSAYYILNEEDSNVTTSAPTSRRLLITVPDTAQLTLASRSFSKIQFDNDWLKKKSEDVLSENLISLFKFLPKVEHKPTLIFTKAENSYSKTSNVLKVAVNLVNGISAPEFILQYGRVLNAQYYPQVWFPNDKENLGNLELMFEDHVFQKIAKAMKLNPQNEDLSFGIGLEIYLRSLGINSALQRTPQSLITDEAYRFVQYKYEPALVNYFSTQFDIENKLQVSRSFAN